MEEKKIKGITIGKNEIKITQFADNIRLIYDLHYTEKENIPGLIMLVDFEKAFDSVSWSFIYRVLDFLNFGNNFKKWIKLFNTNIVASVNQCGFLSVFPY